MPASRLFSKDLTRVLATFLVILGPHTAYELVAAWKGIALSSWLTADIYDAFSRICVPLFVMVSGSLLLTRQEDLKTFCKKRFFRVVIPFVVWVAIYIAWRIAYKHESLSLIDWLREAGTGPVYYHLWFLYMIVGLYAITPLLRALLQRASRRYTVCLLALWLALASLLPSVIYPVNAFLGLNIPYTYCAYGDNYLWMTFGYAGYYLLGGFIASRPPPKVSPAALLAVALALPLLGAWLVYAMNQSAGALTPLPDFMFITISLPAVAVFLLIERYAPRLELAVSPRSRASLARLAQATFGIYLIHPIFRDLLNNGDIFGFHLSAGAFNPVLAIPVTALVLFSVSGIAVLLMMKVPLLNKII